MIKYKGHIRGEVCMPNKPIKRVSKCGVVAVLAVVICTFQVYEGKPIDPALENPQVRCVLLAMSSLK